MREERILFGIIDSNGVLLNSVRGTGIKVNGSLVELWDNVDNSVDYEYLKGIISPPVGGYVVHIVDLDDKL